MIGSCGAQDRKFWINGTDLRPLNGAAVYAIHALRFKAE